MSKSLYLISSIYHSCRSWKTAAACIWQDWIFLILYLSCMRILEDYNHMYFPWTVKSLGTSKVLFRDGENVLPQPPIPKETLTHLWNSLSSSNANGFAIFVSCRQRAWDAARARMIWPSFSVYVHLRKAHPHTHTHTHTCTRMHIHTHTDQSFEVNHKFSGLCELMWPCSEPLANFDGFLIPAFYTSVDYCFCFWNPYRHHLYRWQPYRPHTRKAPHMHNAYAHVSLRAWMI